MSFTEDQDLHELLSNPFAKRTMLTEFFRTNSTHDLAKSLKCTYKEFPEHFFWYPGSKAWSPRKQKDTIGRLVTVNPIEGERYCLRLLLLNVRGPTSFNDLKTVNGVLVDTFKEAAVLRGYFQSDNSQEQCLQEAAVYHMPYTFKTSICHS
ncbi:uncharacterized protein [Coffea arabica]|uniref:Uncharacterized protein n=1 Tax=Coffea arabica TaxID=13443 RepID=A0A6P6V8K5_COFAR|nr:uncharacterized protein LOC113718594 [Coffea arabica]